MRRYRARLMGLAAQAGQLSPHLAVAVLVLFVSAAVAAWLLLAPGGGSRPTGAQQVPLVPHYKVYDIVSPNLVPEGTLYLETQFDEEAIPHSLIEARYLFAPAVKTEYPSGTYLGGDQSAPHLKCYTITGGDNPDYTVALQTQFDADFVEVDVGPAEFMCMPALKQITAPEPGPQPQGPLPEEPHYKCYQISGTDDPSLAVNLLTQFDEQVNVAVNAPRYLCAPAVKTDFGGIPHETLTFPHLKCYDISPWGSNRIEQVALETQFSYETLVEVDQSKLLCVPALKTVISPTPEQPYGCYDLVHPTGGEVNPEVEVTLDTQFGTPTGVPVGAAQKLCAPALKHYDQGPLDGTHLECYDISDFGWDPEYVVQLQTQLDAEPVEVEVGLAMELCAPTLKTLDQSDPGDPPEVPHYVCYDLPDADLAETWDVDAVQTQFNVIEDEPYGPARRLCAPAIKTVTVPPGGPPPQGDKDLPHLECYQMPPGYDPTDAGVNLRTQFGLEEGWIIGAAEWLCLEADKTVVTGPDDCPDPSSVPWSTPPGDADCDGFTSAHETHVGTDPDLACSADRWPPDFNDDHTVDIFDINLLKPHFFSCSPAPAYDVRYDLWPDNCVDIFDINRLKPFFFLSCTPAP